MQIFNEKLRCHKTSIQRWTVNTNAKLHMNWKKIKRRQIAKRLKMSIPWKIGVQCRALCHYQHCISKSNKILQVLAWVYNTPILKGDKSKNLVPIRLRVSWLIATTKTATNRPRLEKEKSGDSWTWSLCLKSHRGYFREYLFSRTHLHTSFSLAFSRRKHRTANWLLAEY